MGGRGLPTRPTRRGAQARPQKTFNRHNHIIKSHHRVPRASMPPAHALCLCFGRNASPTPTPPHPSSAAQALT